MLPRSANLFYRKCHFNYQLLGFSTTNQLLTALNEETLKSNPVVSDWENAKEYSELPGPSKWTLPFGFLPGGKYHNLNLLEVNRMFRTAFGDILRMPGTFGQPDMVFTFNPEDNEAVFRTEGKWPIRMGLRSFVYYRKKVRPEIFGKTGGLLTEDGEAWADMRTKVNPILMKPKAIATHFEEIDNVCIQFFERIKQIRDPDTLMLPINFNSETSRWTTEVTAMIALDTHLGLIRGGNDPESNGERLMQAVKVFFQLSYELDILPSIWEYYKTPAFKKLMKTYDTMTDISLSYVQKKMREIKTSDTEEQPKRGVMRNLLTIDEQAAIVMAIDMIMAGVDTTSSTFLNIMYRLAKSPEKQEKLREEVKKIMPQADQKITEADIRNAPYLRACIKEALRLVPIGTGNARTTTQDLVLSGYQVPKGTCVVMSGMVLCHDNKYFPKSDEFIPERWLKTEEDSLECPSAKNVNPFVYLPFGHGPRSCVGKRIAQMMMEVMIVRLIRNFRVEWIGENMTFGMNLVITPVGDMRFRFVDL